MTREDIDNIIKVICPNNEDFEKPCISPAYLKNELEVLALEQEPCEAISRAYIEPIIEELENICVNGDEHILNLLANIKNAPSVTPQPETGYWIRGKYKDTCSKCRCTYPKNIGLKNYCPNCGARVIEPQAEKE